MQNKNNASFNNFQTKSKYFYCNNNNNVIQKFFKILIEDDP